MVAFAPSPPCSNVSDVNATSRPRHRRIKVMTSHGARGGTGTVRGNGILKGIVPGLALADDGAIQIERVCAPPSCTKNAPRLWFILVGCSFHGSSYVTCRRHSSTRTRMRLVLGPRGRFLGHESFNVRSRMFNWFILPRTRSPFGPRAFSSFFFRLC